MSFKIICSKCNNEIVFENNFEGICIENMIEIAQHNFPKVA